jgi:hypothetical protein
MPSEPILRRLVSCAGQNDAGVDNDGTALRRSGGSQHLNVGLSGGAAASIDPSQAAPAVAIGAEHMTLCGPRRRDHPLRRRISAPSDGADTRKDRVRYPTLAAHYPF